MLSLLALGCTSAPAAIDGGGDAPACEPDRATFTAVQPIVERYCGSCHGTTPDFGAPVSLVEPSSLFAVQADGTRPVDRIATRLLDGTMPPVGMPRLPETDANALAQWASCGAITVPPNSGLVSSDPPFLAPEHAPTGLDTIDLRASGYAVGPSVTDDYHCFVFDAAVDAPRFVRRFEMIYGETAVLHHLVLLRDVDHHTQPGDFDCYDGSGMPAGSQYLYAWAPGQSALEFPDGGLRISPGDRFVVQIHYNNGRHLDGVSDTTGVRMFVGAPEGPEYGMIAMGPTNFSLPPHARTPASSRCTITSDTTIIAGMPHMHLLGSAFDQTITRAGATHADPLVHLSGWTFGTQLFYSMPTTLHAGDVVHTTCTYTNNRDETVGSGENTTDEMCFDFMYATPPPSERYCDEGSDMHPTDIAYVPGACVPSGTPTNLPLVTGRWAMASAPPALTQASVPDARWILDDVAYYVTNAVTPIGTIDLTASYVLARGQLVTSGGTLAYDTVQDTVVITESNVRLGGPGNDSFAGALDTSASPATITDTCPSGGTTTIDWGIDASGLSIGFTSTHSVPGQTLWPRFHFHRAP